MAEQPAPNPGTLVQEARMDKKGRIYYINHTSQSTSWADPDTHLALRCQGLVPPAAMTPTKALAEEPIPSTHERKTAGDGNTYYVNIETGHPSWIHPGFVDKLSDTGETELADVVAIGLDEPRHEGPWIVEYNAGSPCEGEKYWVDYRDESVTDWGPEDRRAGRESVRKMEEKLQAAKE